jgi:hypothetical protein
LLPKRREHRWSRCDKLRSLMRKSAQRVFHCTMIVTIAVFLVTMFVRCRVFVMAFTSVCMTMVCRNDPNDTGAIALKTAHHSDDLRHEHCESAEHEKKPHEW